MQIFLKLRNENGYSMIQSAIVFPIILISLIIMINIITSLFYQSIAILNGLSEHEKDIHIVSGVANYSEEIEYANKDLYYADWHDEIMLYPPYVSSSNNMGGTFVLFDEEKAFKHDYYFESVVIDEATYIQKVDLIIQGSYYLIEAIDNN